MAKALAELKFRRLWKHFMEPSDYDKTTLCKILYFFRSTGLLAEYSRWGRTIDQKMVAVHGSLRATTPVILMHHYSQPPITPFWRDI
jgi:hypothetical protein